MAFRDLRRRLLRRRVSLIDLRLRIELLGLALVVVVFAFWQTRVPLDSVSRENGPLAASGVVIAFWGLLAISAAALAGSRHALQLRRGAGGPSWLALPISPEWVARQLRWEARSHVYWLTAPAVGVLLASVGLVPAWIILALAALFPLWLRAAAELGCIVAFQWCRLRVGARPGVPVLTSLLASARHPSSRARQRRASWRSAPGWLALWHKDALLGRRARARQQFLISLALGVLSVLSWFLPVLPAAARLLAFGLALFASATFGEWLIAISGKDPFPVLRGLPVGFRPLWLSRAAWVVGWSVLLVAAHAIAARPLDERALRLFLVWTGSAALVIGVLAVNYGITLFPRADVGLRIYHLALTVALVISLMIPLAGWVALLAALIHSMRRLPHWSRLEDAP